jgi:hypothetical protein
MIQRSQHIILIAILLAYCFTSPCFSADRGTLLVKDAAAAPGGIAMVEIAMDDLVRGVATFQIRLDFKFAEPPSAPLLRHVPADPQKPQNGEAKYSLGSMVPPSIISLAGSMVPGTLQVAAAGIVPFDGPGTLVTIPLQVPESAAPGTIYNIDLTVISFNDASAKPIPVSVKSGFLRVLRPHRLMVASARNVLPGREVSLPIAYWPGEDCQVHGISMVVRVGAVGNSPRGVSIIGVEAGSPALAAGVFATPKGPFQTNLTVLSPAQPFKPGTLLAKLRILIPPEADTGHSYAVVLQRIQLYPSAADALPTSVTPGEVRITVPPGDINADGRVTIADAVLCIRIVAKLIRPLPDSLPRRADVAPKNPNGTYGNGLVTISDATKILKRALGLEPDPWP